MTTTIKETKDSTVLEDNQLLCVLTTQPKKVNASIERMEKEFISHRQ